MTTAKNEDVEIVGLRYGHCSSMAMCKCGDVFRASGDYHKVTQKQKAWDTKHAKCAEKKREGRKVFWLSFTDDTRPKGQQFLGACLIDVTAEEADEAMLTILLKFPLAEPDAEWLGAAIRKAHALKCNPGGQVASMEIPADHPHLALYRFGVLMDRNTIEALEPDDDGA